MKLNTDRHTERLTYQETDNDRERERDEPLNANFELFFETLHKCLASSNVHFCKFLFILFTYELTGAKLKCPKLITIHVYLKIANTHFKRYLLN